MNAAKKRRPLLNLDLFVAAMEGIDDKTHEFSCCAIESAAGNWDDIPEVEFYRRIYNLDKTHGCGSGRYGRYTFRAVAMNEGLGTINDDNELRGIRVLALGFALAMAEDRNNHR